MNNKIMDELLEEAYNRFKSKSVCEQNYIMRTYGASEDYEISRLRILKTND